MSSSPTLPWPTADAFLDQDSAAQEAPDLARAVALRRTRGRVHQRRLRHSSRGACEGPGEGEDPGRPPRRWDQLRRIGKGSR